MARNLRTWNRSSERRPREVVQSAVYRLAQDLKGAGFEYAVCGSWRRRTPTLKDLDVLVFSIHGKPASALSAAEVIDDMDILRGGYKVTNGTIVDLPIDIWSVMPGERGAMLWFATGPSQLNIRMRVSAKAHGMKLSQYGVFDRETNQKLDDGTEEGVAEALNWPWIPPEERDNWKRYKR